MALNLPTNPTKNGEFVLIYGGSSATGTLGIQFAKL
jgi:NADPH:quinone reductase-like Zn-dependent oxidoreductase